MVRLEQQKCLDRDDILKLYTKGYTKAEDFKIGMEYERLPISTTSFKAIDYWSEFGIKNFLEEFAKRIYVGLYSGCEKYYRVEKNHDTITLEPGSQIEISVEPQKQSFRLKKK